MVSLNVGGMVRGGRVICLDMGMNGEIKRQPAARADNRLSKKKNRKRIND